MGVKEGKDRRTQKRRGVKGILVKIQAVVCGSRDHSRCYLKGSEFEKWEVKIGGEIVVHQRDGKLSYIYLFYSVG